MTDRVVVEGTVIHVVTIGEAGQAPSFAYADFETPGGTINSSNRNFTLAHTPSPAASVQLFLNGILQRAATDYTLTAAAIQYSVGATPQTGDNHYAYYRY